MPGPGRPMPRGMKPTVENPGKILKRIIGFVTKNYLLHCIVVLICIVVSVLANVQGTWFTKNLIDQYIEPLLKTSALGLEPDYSGLLQAIARVACFYAIGIVASYLNTRKLV